MTKLAQAEQLIDDKNLDGWFFISSSGSDVHTRLLTGGLASHARASFMITPPGETNTILIYRLEFDMMERKVNELGVDFDVLPIKNIEEEINCIKGVFQGKDIVAVNYIEPDNGFLSKDYISGTDVLRHGEYLMLVNLFPDVFFVPARPLICDLRTKKSLEEINNLEEAVKLATVILEDVPNFLQKKDITEKDLAADIEYRASKEAEVAFGTIVATGPGSADPHYNPQKKKIKEGVLLIDMGVRVGICSCDITRTLYLGTPPRDFVQAYEAVYDAKEAAVTALKAGSRNKDVAQVARNKFTELGYDHEKLFIHGLGHPIGIDVGDIGPRLSVQASKEAILEENSIYTIEPGLYWKEKYGIRLEDDYVIKRDSNKCFAKAPREIITI
ncbi:MAG: M24 family metallopeptidase [Candidatus Hodarchaeales archaeon]|jgi:Xaa-Pro aminopeptidase